MSPKNYLTSGFNKISLLYLCIVLAMVACKKKDKDPEPQKQGVTINGGFYTTVKIGNQLWTSVNYNGAGGVNYNNGSNDAAYGKYYTRQEAQAIVLQDGWRLPSKADFDKLVSSFPTQTINGYTALTSESLKQILSSSGWDINGNNASGFNALPAGIVYIDAGGNNIFRYRGIEAQFVSSTNEMVTGGGTTKEATWTLYLHSEVITGQNPFTDFIGGVSGVSNSDSYRYSVRFVKDVN